MARDWDTLFDSWKSPPSDSEQQRAEAIRAAITKAIVNNSRFASLHPRFLLQVPLTLIRPVHRSHVNGRTGMPYSAMKIKTAAKAPT
ncbi:MAG: hypothetical protein ACYC2H_02015 [Thermoplasmatota archaeon]